MKLLARGGYGESFEEGALVHKTARTGHLDMLVHEYSIMKTLDHPNVVRVVHYCDERGSIVMEHGGRDWFTVAQEDVPSGALLRDQVRQLVTGVAYLHRHGVAHRDLKLENVTTDATGRVRIIDFGLALKLKPDEVGRRCVRHKVGSTAYAAPEVHHASERRQYDPFAADVWALGITIFAFTKNTLLFEVASGDDLRYTRYSLHQQLLSPVESLVHVYGWERSLFEDWLATVLDGALQVVPDRRVKLHLAEDRA